MRGCQVQKDLDATTSLFSIAQSIRPLIAYYQLLIPKFFFSFESNVYPIISAVMSNMSSNWGERKLNSVYVSSIKYCDKKLN